MSIATLTSKGQITIPQDIRNYLHLKPGHRIEFIEKNGKVIMLPVSIDVSELLGILPPPKKRVSLSEMKKAISKRGSRKCKV